MDDGAEKGTLVGVLEPTYLSAELVAHCLPLPSERWIPKFAIILSLEIILLLLKHVNLLLACLEVLLTAFLAQTDRLGAICLRNSLLLLFNRLLWRVLKSLGALVLSYIILNHDLLFQLWQ